MVFLDATSSFDPFACKLQLIDISFRVCRRPKTCEVSGPMAADGSHRGSKVQDMGVPVPLRGIQIPVCLMKRSSVWETPTWLQIMRDFESGRVGTFGTCMFKHQCAAVAVGSC